MIEGKKPTERIARHVRFCRGEQGSNPSVYFQKIKSQPLLQLHSNQQPKDESRSKNKCTFRFINIALVLHKKKLEHKEKPYRQRKREEKATALRIHDSILQAKRIPIQQKKMQNPILINLDQQVVTEHGMHPGAFSLVSINLHHKGTEFNSTIYPT